MKRVVPADAAPRRHSDSRWRRSHGTARNCATRRMPRKHRLRCLRKIQLIDTRMAELATLRAGLGVRVGTGCPLQATD